jgi:hypothetical protein
MGFLLTKFRRILHYPSINGIGVGELPMLRLVAIAVTCLMVVAALLIVVDPAAAQTAAEQLRPVSTRGGPAPLVGVGLPLFAGVLAILMVVRGYWRKR